jgi:hypothetical protein
MRRFPVLPRRARHVDVPRLSDAELTAIARRLDGFSNLDDEHDGRDGLNPDIADLIGQAFTRDETVT